MNFQNKFFLFKKKAMSYPLNSRSEFLNSDNFTNNTSGMIFSEIHSNFRSLKHVTLDFINI